MLGTNLSMGEDGTKGTDTSRLMLLDDDTFPELCLQLDDLIESYVQTVLAATAVEDLCQQLMPGEGVFNLKLFLQLDEDRALLNEIARGCVQIMDLHPELHPNGNASSSTSSLASTSSRNVTVDSSNVDDPTTSWPIQPTPMLRYKV